MKNLSALCVAALFLLTGCSSPRAGKLTLDDFYGANRIDLDGDYARDIEWTAEPGRYRTIRNSEPVIVDAATNAEIPDANYSKIRDAIAAHADFDENSTRRFAREALKQLQDADAALISHQDKLYVYQKTANTIKKVGDADKNRKITTLSPAGRYISFVRNHNLYVIDTTTGDEIQLTQDGSDRYFNGELDWIYQEEVYGRGNYRGHWWRDDDQKLAFLQLDQSDVPIFTILDQVTPHPELETLPYPKPGDPNPEARLGVIDLATRETTWLDISKYANDEPLIVRVSWSPRGTVIFQVQNREQTWLDLNEYDPTTAISRTLIRETSPAWVNVLDEPHWLPDGSFLWESERDGFQHLYHYDASGALRKQITTGEWEIRDFLGIDDSGETAYVTATLDSSIENHAYRVALSGDSAPQRLTALGFTHRIEFDASHSYFIDTYSSVSSPPRVDLRAADGSLLRMISENPANPTKDYHLPTPEFVKVPTRDGFLMNAMLIKPRNYSPLKRYPVWCFVYGGPQAPQVHNRWPSRDRQWFDTLLANDGYVIWVCDPRSASGKGAKYAWEAYKQLGVLELQDLEDGIDWLAKKGIADRDRVGIWGFSYGGYLTSYAMTHSEVFKVGIAGGTVTDWRNYDSIYTERYMQKPENNAAGYDLSSVSKAASNLQGKLLLVHGLIDENVHFQNAVEFIYKLQSANKLFEIMIYPKNRHGIRTNARHFAETRLNFVRENL
ncbi:MAG: S9 family peptidase [Phycisphaerae bacterium]